MKFRSIVWLLVFVCVNQVVYGLGAPSHTSSGLGGSDQDDQQVGGSSDNSGQLGGGSQSTGGLGSGDSDQQDLGGSGSDGGTVGEGQQEDPDITGTSDQYANLGAGQQDQQGPGVSGQDDTQLGGNFDDTELGAATGDSVNIGAPNFARRDQIITLLLNPNYQAAIALLVEPGLDRSSFINSYQTAIGDFAQAYNTVGMAINLNDTSNRFIDTVKVLSQLFVNDIQTLVEKITLNISSGEDYQDDIPSLQDILAQHDSSLNMLADQYFSDKKDDFLQYYNPFRNTLVVTVFNNLLQNLVETTQDYIEAIIPQAESYVQYCDDSWKPTLIILGYQTSTKAKEAFNTAMAQIYEGRGQQLLDGIDFENTSQSIIERAFADAESLFTQASERYETVNKVAEKFAAQEKAEQAGIKKASYSAAWTDKTQAESLAASNDLSSKQQAVSLFNDAYEKFQKAGDILNAERMNTQYNKVQGDVGLQEGKNSINQYVTVAQDYIDAQSETRVNRILAIKSGFVLADDGAIFNEVIDHYQSAAQFYVQSGLSILHFQDGTSDDVDVKALVDAHEILITVTNINALRKQADAQAAGLTIDALGQAEQTYDQARAKCIQADQLVFSDPDLMLDMQIYPGFIAENIAINYQYVLNNYIGDYYRNICLPLLDSQSTDQAEIALAYYSAAASRGVDMSTELSAVQEIVGLVEAARDAKSTAEQTSDWTNNSTSSVYDSVSNIAWKRVLNLYQAAVEADIPEAKDEALTVLQEYAQLYHDNVPQAFFPKLGSVLLYQQLKTAYENKSLTDKVAEIQIAIDTVIGEINSYITNELSISVIDGLMAQKQFSEAISRQQQLVVYYQQKYANTDVSVLGKTQDEINAVIVKELDIYAAWGTDQLEQKYYNNAYTYLVTARAGYKELGRDDKANETTLRQNYFRAKTLATALKIYETVYTDGTLSLADRFTVPRNYFLTESQQIIPNGVPTSGDPYDIAMYTYVAYALSDKGIEYTDAYSEGTFNRTNNLDTDKEQIVSSIEVDALAFKAMLQDQIGYEVSVTLDGIQYILKEEDKPIPAVQGQYLTAPTTVGYYMASLLLARPGTQLVSFSGKSYVPGQDDDWAWQLGKDLAFSFLSEATVLNNELPDLRVMQERSFDAFDSLRSSYGDIYTRYIQAYAFLNGKEHQESFYGTSRFADDATFMNKLMAEMWSSAAENMKEFIIGDPSEILFQSAVDEAFQDYMSARQHYVAWYTDQGISSEYSMPEANQMLLKSAQLFESSGDRCMEEEKFYQYAAPYYGTAVVTYDTLVSNGIVTLNDIDLVAQKDAVTIKLYESYLKMASSKMTEFDSLKNDGSLATLVDKYNNFITGSATMTNDEIKEYGRIEDLALDTLMNILYVQDSFSSLVPEAQKDAASVTVYPPGPDGGEPPPSMIDTYITSSGFDVAVINDNEAFQAMFMSGYQHFLDAIADKNVRYTAISGWMSKNYISFSQTYMNIYLRDLAVDSQMTELNSRIQARVRELSGGIDLT